MNSFLTVNKNDNVAVALTDTHSVPFGHKIALRDIREGDAIIKYGFPIGHASCDIKMGDWVHSHNLSTNLKGIIEYSYNPSFDLEKNDLDIPKTFMGYRRKDGRVATRNEIWVIPTVSCVNKLAEKLAFVADKGFGKLCDGIFAYPHNAGCSQMGEDFSISQRILSSIVKHPNAGGVLVLSLGCENNDLEHFIPLLDEYDNKRIRTLVTQDYDGDEFEEGIRILREIAEEITEDKREVVPVSDLIIGLKCGGSDAFSGITANPLCGSISEKVTNLGGSALLTEVPEMFGAEQLLMDRADSMDTFERIVSLINEFKSYYLSYNQPIDDNPSPGNKKGGITTLEEKSLGCVQKGGHAKVVDILSYGEAVSRKGLNLVNGPGNDSVSVTNLLASGAQIILFTTGRGNPLGTAVPTIKISSNTALFNRKRDWIDFNAGEIVNGSNFDEESAKLWSFIIDVASGKIKTKSEQNNYKEIMLFKDGVIL